MWGDLRRVLVRRPLPADAGAWEAYGWRGAPGRRRRAGGARGVLRSCSRRRAPRSSSPSTTPGNPDAIYTYDPTLVGRDGAVLLLPGKEGRRREPEATVAPLEAAGVPIAARIEPARDRRGRRHGLARRADAARRDRLPHEPAPRSTPSRAAFPGVEVIAFDLPHWNGAGEVMHLMSFISPLDRDLALVYPRIAPTRLMWLLAERGIEVVEVPDEEFETQGPNVLALGPRRALALEGNDETRRRMERAGVDVVTYRGDEISRKGDGGPTCLTRPLLRGLSAQSSSSVSWRTAVSPETPTPTRRSAPGRSRRPRSRSRQARSPIRSGSSIGVGSVVERERSEKSA